MPFPFSRKNSLKTKELSFQLGKIETVLHLLTQGYCDKEIAHKVGTTNKCIRTYISYYRNKHDLKYATRIQLGSFYMREKLMQDTLGADWREKH